VPRQLAAARPEAAAAIDGTGVAIGGGDWIIWRAGASTTGGVAGADAVGRGGIGSVRFGGGISAAARREASDAGSVS
jgi:hypothetical protein